MKVPKIMQKKERNTSIHRHRKEEGTKLGIENTDMFVAVSNFFMLLDVNSAAMVINSALLRNCNPLFSYTKSKMAHIIRNISQLIKTF